MNAIARRLALPAAAAAVLATSLIGCQTGSTNNTLYRLRMCETGGNYRMHTWAGNVEYGGAYGFNVHYWYAMGYSPAPQNASPALQDAVELRIIGQMGVHNTNPGCADRLGL